MQYVFKWDIIQIKNAAIRVLNHRTPTSIIQVKILNNIISEVYYKY